MTNALFRPRTLVYALIWGGLGLALLTALFLRDRLDVTVEHDRNPKFVVLSDGSIRNGYTLKIANMRLEPRMFELSVEGLPDATMTLAGSGETARSDESLRLMAPADKVQETRLYVTRSSAEAAKDDDFRFIVRDLFGEDRAVYDAAFAGPEE